MQLQIFQHSNSSFALPLYQSRIQCGFPSPADDYLEGVLTLDEICIDNKETTFLGRVTGKSLNDINIYEGDILVIDRGLKAVSGDLIVAAINGEFNAKFLNIEGKKISLLSANRTFKPIVIDELTDFQVWGVVTRVIQDIRRRWNGGNS